MIWRLFPYIAKADVLDHLRVKPALADNLLEDLEHQAIERSVLEAALAGFGQGSPDGEGDDNVIGVLGGAVGDVRSATCLPCESDGEGSGEEVGIGRRVHLLEGALAARSDVGEDVGETLGGHCDLIVGVLVVCRCVARNSRARGLRGGIRSLKIAKLSEGQLGNRGCLGQTIGSDKDKEHPSES